MHASNPAADMAVSALIDLGLTQGSARGIVRDFPTLSLLASASESRLRLHGVRPGQAKRIAAAFRLVRLADSTPPGKACEGGRLGCPSEVVTFARAKWGFEDREHFGVLYLDARQRVIEARTIGIGSLTQVDVQPREIFAPAMEPPKAHSVILVHNHPSDDPEPSDADIALTRRLVEVGKLVGVPVLDHVIVAPSESVSLAARGMVGAA